MTVISGENISKRFGDKLLLDGIDLAISAGEKVGVIGRNGAGKTTLLNLIAGIDTPDSGTILVPKSIHIEYLNQDPQLNSDSSVLEQVQTNTPAGNLISKYEEILHYLVEDPDNRLLQDELLEISEQMTAIGAWQIDSQFKTVLTQLGISDFNASVRTLSGGQKKRVALARSITAACDLLILDEPTNHLDDQMVIWLEDFLQNRKGALLMVTHDRYFLDRIVSRIIELDSGKLNSYSGSYAYYLDKKSQQQAIQATTAENRVKLYKRELEWIRSGAKARTTKQKARIQRFEELKESLATEDKKNLDLAVGYTRLGRKIIEIESLSKCLDNKLLFRDFNYILRPDDRIGIIGPNASGKSTLLKILASKMDPDQGKIDTGTTVQIGYLPQESEYMEGSLKAIDYIRDTAEFIMGPKGVKISAAQMMERFLFPRDLQWVSISRLSGGEQRRLYLLKILMQSPNVLLLDEPTNDLDIETLTVLEDYLDDFPGAVISISHDRYFLDRTCHRMWVFRGETIKEYTGNFSDWQEFDRSIDHQPQTNQRKSDTQRNLNKSKYTKLKFSYREQREYETIEQDIEKLEERIAAVDELMLTANSDFVELQELLDEKNRLEDELLFKMERYDYLRSLEIRINAQKLD